VCVCVCVCARARACIFIYITVIQPTLHHKNRLRVGKQATEAAVLANNKSLNEFHFLKDQAAGRSSLGSPTAFLSVSDRGTAVLDLTALP
jgi:hypothetical protein